MSFNNYQFSYLDPTLLALFFFLIIIIIIIFYFGVELKNGVTKGWLEQWRYQKSKSQG